MHPTWPGLGNELGQPFSNVAWRGGNAGLLFGAALEPNPIANPTIRLGWPRIADAPLGQALEPNPSNNSLVGPGGAPRGLHGAVAWQRLEIHAQLSG
eukprot:2761577-Pyramimonas_sp.AAC.1